MGGDRSRFCGTRCGALVLTRALTLTILIAGALVAPQAQAQASTPNHAGVLVRDAHGRTHRMCIVFDEHTITGLDLLRRTGYSVDLSQSSLGSAVCKINGDGCSSGGNCFCHYPTFWGYWTRNANQSSWRFSDAGAQARVVRDGALDAWVWGRNGAPAPKDVAFREVCPLAAGRTSTAKSTSAKGNYLAFAGFVAAFAVAGGFFARRRAKRPP